MIFSLKTAQVLKQECNVEPPLVLSRSGVVILSVCIYQVELFPTTPSFTDHFQRPWFFTAQHSKIVLHFRGLDALQRWCSSWVGGVFSGRFSLGACFWGEVHWDWDLIPTTRWGRECLPPMWRSDSCEGRSLSFFHFYHCTFLASPVQLNASETTYIICQSSRVVVIH